MANTVTDTEMKVPYSYKSDVWVGYDNPDSVLAKVNTALLITTTSICLLMFIGVCLLHSGFNRL